MSRCIDDRILLHLRLKICYDIFKVICDNRTILLLLFSWCYVWLCDPMDCGRPGFPILHHILAFVQAHVHWVGDAIQPSHPVIPFSCLQTFPESGSFLITLLFTSGSQSISFSFSISPSSEYSGLASFRIDWFDLLAVKGLSRILSNTTIWKHQFFSAWISLWFNSHIHT